MICVMLFFFFSSIRRHTRCALVTGVQTCALPIFMQQPMPFQPTRRAFIGAALALGLPGTAMAATNAQRLVRAARRQVGVTLSYDPAYSVLRFPNGDVDRAKGVCTDDEIGRAHV